MVARKKTKQFPFAHWYEISLEKKKKRKNWHRKLATNVDITASIHRHERTSKLSHDTGSYISARPNKWPSVAGCCGRARHPVLQADRTCDRSLLEHPRVSSRFYLPSTSRVLQPPTVYISRLSSVPVRRSAYFCHLISIIAVWCA